MSRYSDIVAAWSAGPDESVRKTNQKQQNAAIVRRLINEFAAYIEWPDKPVLSKPGPKGEYVGPSGVKSEDGIAVDYDGSMSCFADFKMPAIDGRSSTIFVYINVLMIGDMARLTIFDEYEIHDPGNSGSWDTLWEKAFGRFKAQAYASRPGRK